VFPREVRLLDNVWIPLADGCRLSARIWRPVDAEDDPVPVILEYLPYRKDDFTAERDACMHPYFAGHGYASVRVDLRGSGDSDGILADEYLPQEQDDAVEVIAWLARQRWSTGAVGIIGLSWGGVNGLQIAARRPPELKAIISLYSTDDRYADDVHYTGGCVGFEMLTWATTMLARNARPPLPSIVGDGWRDAWLDRMERTPPHIEPWLTHQRRDAYWKHGSVREDFGAIECPVYAIGGWADGYSNAVPRLIEGLPEPAKGLIGPWGHTYPELPGTLGPRIGFLQECLRWWDQWLKGIDTGIMAEPKLRVWMLDAFEPRPSYDEWPGRWVAEPAWPSPNVRPQTLVLNPERLDGEPAAERELSLLGVQTAGRDAGIWCPYGAPGDFPADQRSEDGLSLCFTSDPLPEPLEILGFPEAHLLVAVDQPNALVVARLCDIAPTGASTLITRGQLNLTHHQSDEHPQPLVPGKRFSAAIRLNAIAYALPKGHRLRLAISPTYWPHAWPSPAPVTLSLFTGGASMLHLPTRLAPPEEPALRDFAPPETAPPLAVETLRTGSTEPLTTWMDGARNRQEITYRDERGRRRLVASGVEYEFDHVDQFSITADDPLSAVVRSERRYGVGQGRWQTRVEASGTMTADSAEFLVTQHLHAYENETRVFAKSWCFRFPRDLV